MLFLIILIVVSAALMIGAYQVMLYKYYWGPNGKPRARGPKTVRQKR
jgi:hypothetical protein